MDKQAESKPYDGPYIFINSVGDRLTRSRDEMFAISSHVSKTHRKWTKEERLKKLHESAGKAVAPRPILPALPPTLALHTSPSADVPRVLKAIDSNQRREDERTSSSQATHPSSTNVTQGQVVGYALGMKDSQHDFPFETSQEKIDRRRPARSRIQGQHSRAITRPSPALWKGNSDPFSTTVVPLTPFDHEIIRQAQRFLVFAAWPDKASAVFRAPIADTASSHIQLGNTITDEAEIHAILASGYHVAADASDGSSDTALARCLVHKGQAVALLRQKLLSKGFSESVSTLIRLLISLDFQAGDYTAALTHLRGLWAISSSMPGMLVDTKELLLVSDVWIALSLLKKPEISPAGYDPGPRLLAPFDIALRLLETDNTISVSNEPEKARWTASVLDARTVTLLDAAAEVVHTKETMSKINDSALQQEVVWWMHRRASATSGSLVTGYVEAMEAASLKSLHHAKVAGRLLDAAACLCGIMFMNFRFVDSPSNYNFSKTFLAIEPVLRAVGAVLREHPSQDCDECYLWLLFMCAMGNDVYASRGDIPYASWPASEFHSVCARLGLTDQKETATTLRRFPYYPQMDDLFVALFSLARKAPETSIIPWSRWCLILDHCVQ